MMKVGAIAAAAGVEPWVLINYLTRGIISADRRDKEGRGRHRLFREETALRAVVIVRLVQFGFLPSRARELVEHADMSGKQLSLEEESISVIVDLAAMRKKLC